MTGCTKIYKNYSKNSGANNIVYDISCNTSQFKDYYGFSKKEI